MAPGPPPGSRVLQFPGGKVIYVRVPLHANVISHISTRLWSASLALGNHLAENPDLVEGDRCLELGCGFGVPGLVAAALGASEVVLTDCTSVALQLARDNLRLCGAPGSSFSASHSHSVHVKYLRWEQDLSIRSYLSIDAPYDCGSEGLPDGATFDVVLGSECVYSIGHARLLPKVAMHRLRPGGRAIITAAIRASTHHDDFLETCRMTPDLCNLTEQWFEIPFEERSQEDQTEEEDYSRGFLLVTFQKRVPKSTQPLKVDPVVERGPAPTGHSLQAHSRTTEDDVDLDELD